jgi:hypothetical protein
MRAKWYSVCGIHQTRERIDGPCPYCAAHIEDERTQSAPAMSSQKRVGSQKALARIRAGQAKGRETQRQRGIGLDAANCAAIAERRSWERADEELRRG